MIDECLWFLLSVQASLEHDKEPVVHATLLKTDITCIWFGNSKVIISDFSEFIEL